MELLISGIILFPLAFLILFSGLVVSFIQGVCFLLLWPLSKTIYRRISKRVVEILWLVYLWLIQYWGGYKVQLVTDPETFNLLGKEHAILMSNHVADIDLLFIWTIAQQFDCLGSAPAYSRHPFQFLPVIGWTFWFSDFIFLRRRWAEDQPKLKSQLKDFKNIPHPFWLTIYAEGTRFTQKKLISAQEHAVSRELPIPRNVLIPRTKGFVTAVKCMRDFVPVVYDVTFAIPKSDPPPSISNMARRRGAPLKIYIKRHSMKEIPESDEGIAKWCRDRFIAKDALLEQFAAKGTNGDQKHHGIRVPKSIYVTMFWSCALLVSIYKAYDVVMSSWKGIGAAGAGITFIFTWIYIVLSYSEAERLEKDKPNAKK